MQEEKGTSIEVPHEYICPIIQKIMHIPVVAADGHSYEHSAIKRWLDAGQPRSPMTGVRLKHKELMPNYALRKLTHDFMEALPEWEKQQVTEKDLMMAIRLHRVLQLYL